MFIAEVEKRFRRIHFTTGFQLVPIQWKMKKKSLYRRKTYQKLPYILTAHT